MHNLMTQFRTKINISIDAFGEANEYIRWPSSWNKTAKNVDKIISLPNTQIKLNPTVAAYNIRLLPELYEWAIGIGIERFNFDSVYQPKFLAQTIANNGKKKYTKTFVEKLMA